MPRYTLFHETGQFGAAPWKEARSRNANKSVLCRGPESDRRHMVLQVMFPAIREIAPERQARRHMVMTNDKLFNKKDGEQAFPSWAVMTDGSVPREPLRRRRASLLGAR